MVKKGIMEPAAWHSFLFPYDKKWSPRFRI